jgi:hypothetical protein
MFKGKLAVLCLAAVALLVANSTAFAGIIDPCDSGATLELDTAPGPVVPLAVCPQGDTDSFLIQGWYLAITIVDGVGAGVPDISGTDFWLDDCDPNQDLIVLCGGSASSGADSLTNSAGQTTMSNTSLAAGLCTDGLIVIVQGSILEGPLRMTRARITTRTGPIRFRI